MKQHQESKKKNEPKQNEMRWSTRMVTGILPSYIQILLDENTRQTINTRVLYPTHKKRHHTKLIPLERTIQNQSH